MDVTQLKDRDYTVIIDKSGSMGANLPSGQSRWNAAREGTEALARKLAEFDPDGLTLYTFAGSFKRYENVTPDKVSQVWQENEPNGGTDLAIVLSHAFNDYFQRKSSGKTKANGDLIVVVTDGEPNDKQAAARVIVEATKKMDKDEELAVQFLQIGDDVGATNFLSYLDDELVSKLGAKFDIVDTTKASDAENMTFTELLLKTITD